MEHHSGCAQCPSDRDRNRPSRTRRHAGGPRQRDVRYPGSVERFIADDALAGVDVVGSSMGARIVLELAQRGGVGTVVALDPDGSGVDGNGPT